MTKREQEQQNYVIAAQNVRRQLIDANILTEDTKAINYDVLDRIIKYFNGNLVVNYNYTYHFHKTSNETFTVCISNDIKKENQIITALQALAIRIMVFDKLSNGQFIRLNYNDFAHDIKDIEMMKGIYSFAREFLMPKDLFLESINNHLIDKKTYDYEAVAQDFEVHPMKVLSRDSDFEFEKSPGCK